MPYVITNKCLGERYAACVDVCPVECIHPGDYQGQEFMIIDPEVCIDCGACLPECPIGAIVGAIVGFAAFSVFERYLDSTVKSQTKSRK